MDNGNQNNQRFSRSRQAESLHAAERAIQKIAAKERTTPELVRKHIQASMMAGLLSDDPQVQAAWRKIPCAGELPTPEEVIACYADACSFPANLLKNRI